MADYYYQTQGSLSGKVINIPFAFSSNGRVDAVDASSAAAWKSKLITVLMTGRGMRVWYDRYGASLSESMTFETVNEAVSFLGDSIRESVSRWIPEVTIMDTLYNYDPNTGTLVISVLYMLPDGSQDKISLRQTSISPAGDSLQVVWNG